MQLTHYRKLTNILSYYQIKLDYFDRIHDNTYTFMNYLKILYNLNIITYINLQINYYHKLSHEHKMNFNKVMYFQYIRIILHHLILDLQINLNRTMCIPFLKILSIFCKISNKDSIFFRLIRTNMKKLSHLHKKINMLFY